MEQQKQQQRSQSFSVCKWVFNLVSLYLVQAKACRSFLCFESLSLPNYYLAAGYPAGNNKKITVKLLRSTHPESDVSIIHRSWEGGGGGGYIQDELYNLNFNYNHFKITSESCNLIGS